MKFLGYFLLLTKLLIKIRDFFHFFTGVRKGRMDRITEME